MDNKFKAIPNHVAIIMDGNGRWAKKRLLPRVAGHHQGAQTIKKVAKRANQLGIKVLSLYAFSTENWGRPEKEVKFLMDLPKEFFKTYLPELMEEGVKLEVMGDLSTLPSATREIIETALDQTKHNTGLILNFLINYGGRQEITKAMQAIGQEIQAGRIQADQVDETYIEQHLMSAKLGAYTQPDLMIRTSGEERLSNFLLWQVAYSEFYFTNTLWPDFDAEALDLAIQEYGQRQRRYGKVL